MGTYLNPDNRLFQIAVKSKIYVDKTELLELSNAVLDTEDRYICVSRPRRFGKSMAANMLAAYYSAGCSSHELFEKLKISKSAFYHTHLNQYNVIYLNMTQFLSSGNTIQKSLGYICEILLFELRQEFGDVNCFNWSDLISVLNAVYNTKHVPFVFIIDEWDCVFREHKDDTASQKEYLDFLRNLLKDRNYVALAYMTGILPIKKYGKHSALNMFTEVSMTDVREFAEFTGFTEAEVKKLCDEYNMPFEDVKRWYDGYNLRDVSVYNPRSVVMSMKGGYFNNYWTATETYEALKIYIEMNFDGLREKIVQMIAGSSAKVNTAKFQNDMTTFHSADDVLTLLVHLGYLSYDFEKSEVHIPNSEVQQEFINSIEDGGWQSVMQSIRQSEQLLDATIAGDADTVAAMIEQAHQENTSILKYNDENALACVLSLAYYSARRKYSIIRELPAGKGFADLVFIPFRNMEAPAMVIELKYEKSAETAIDQIKQKQYSDALRDFSGEILLVGINYDAEKKHTCVIENVIK